MTETDPAFIFLFFLRRVYIFYVIFQFRLVMHYLAEMTDEQTLAMYSGHPLGLFPSTRSGPRVVITNGMVIPNYSSRDHYDKMFALGVTM